MGERCWWEEVWRMASMEHDSGTFDNCRMLLDASRVERRIIIVADWHLLGVNEEDDNENEDVNVNVVYD